MPKTSKQMEVTGTVERCTLESRKPFRTSYYSPNGEHDEFYLDVALRLDDGTAVYFKTPAARRVIAFGGGAAVVMYFVDGGAADWLVEVGTAKLVAVRLLARATATAWKPRLR
jgi:hypothetical protein